MLSNLGVLRGLLKKLSLKDLHLAGKKVLLRVDFNVPLNPDGSISDSTRIEEALPSIRYILEQGGAVILLSHMGRPDGKKNSKYSLKICADYLQKFLPNPVKFVPDCIGPDAEEAARTLKMGEILFLENLRFYPAEEHPELDPNFSKNLAKMGDLYVDDAFGAAHRAHASIVFVPQFFQEKSAAGFLMQKEMQFLSTLLTNAKHPFHVIIGGAKVSTKLGVLTSLVNKMDAVYIGGGMAYTFLKALGKSIGHSICEDNLLDQARQFLDVCSSKNIEVYLPEDLVIADSFKENAPHKVVSAVEGIQAPWQGMDIGPQTIELWKSRLVKASTVFWNGPLGVFEFPEFAKGTNAIAHILSHLDATTVAGGGDSVAAINRLGIAKQFSHVSTGGGASLEYLENGSLPGIDALSAVHTQTT